VAIPSVSYTFTNGTASDATKVNQNFTDIISGLTDGTKSLTIDALTCNGSVALKGHVALGDGTPDDLSFLGSLATSIPIKANTTYDIGSSQFGLAGVYIGAGGTKTVRVVAPTLTGASYTATLPDGAPAGTRFMRMASTGAISMSSSDKIQTAEIDDLAVTTDKLAAGAVTQAKRAALGQQISSGSGTFTSTSTSMTPVTNLEVTITTTGRPVFLAMQWDPSAGAGNSMLFQTVSDSGISEYQLSRTGSSSGTLGYTRLQPIGASYILSGYGPIFLGIDPVSAGTYTYTLQVKLGAAGTWRVYFAQLVAFEL
jgi:hypothetical protein